VKKLVIFAVKNLTNLIINHALASTAIRPYAWIAIRNTLRLQPRMHTV